MGTGAIPKKICLISVDLYIASSRSPDKLIGYENAATNIHSGRKIFIILQILRKK